MSSTTPMADNILHKNEKELLQQIWGRHGNPDAILAEKALDLKRTQQLLLSLQTLEKAIHQTSISSTSLSNKVHKLNKSLTYATWVGALATLAGFIVACIALATKT